MAIHTVSDDDKIRVIDHLIIREKGEKREGRAPSRFVIEGLSAIAKDLRSRQGPKRSEALRSLEPEILLIKEAGQPTKSQLERLGKKLVAVWASVKSALEEGSS